MTEEAWWIWYLESVWARRHLTKNPRRIRRELRSLISTVRSCRNIVPDDTKKALTTTQKV